MNVEMASFLNMQGTSFVVDSFEDVVDIVVHYSHSIQPFFCGRGGDFVVIVEKYGQWIKDIETSIWREFVGRGGCGIVGKFCGRKPCLPAILPIVAVDG